MFYKWQYFYCSSKEILKAIYFESCQCFVVILIIYYSGSSEKKEEKSVNGEKEDSVENGEDEVPEDEEEICYDKNKSFFDNISCEATERAKGLVELVPTSLSRPIHWFSWLLICKLHNFVVDEAKCITCNSHVYDKPQEKLIKLFGKPAMFKNYQQWLNVATLIR